MPIVSISLPKKTIEKIDEIKNEYGFVGRSEIIRYALRQMLSELKKPEKEEIINALIIVVHKEDKENKIDEVKHRFKSLINVQLHSQLEKNECMEIFLLKGRVNKIKRLSNLFKTIKGIVYSKLIII